MWSSGSLTVITGRIAVGKTTLVRVLLVSLLSARLKQAFRLPPLEGVQHLHKVIEDIFVLVETHMPEFDTALYRKKARCTRFGQLIARPRVRRCSRNERSQATEEGQDTEHQEESGKAHQALRGENQGGRAEMTQNRTHR